MIDLWSVPTARARLILVTERAKRITRLIEKPRMMTPEAAAVVVDAAMFGTGCLEGDVRKQIEIDKKPRVV